MKKQVSVFGLHTRAALNRLLLAALGLLAVELILAGVCIARGTALTLSGSRLETALQHSFRAGILALQVLLASSLGSNSRYGYTLRFVLALGCVTACIQLGLRRKGSRGWLVCMGLTFLLVLNLSVQYTAGRSTGIFHAITALLVGLCFLGFGLTQTHNGKDGLADEVD